MNTEPTTPPDLARMILDRALMMAEASHWESLRLHDVSMALGISLEDVRHCFKQKDDLVEAWFDRADSAMLLDATQPGYSALQGHRRLYRSQMAWLQALNPHRRLTREMLAYKLEPGHVHLQVLGALRVSRTVQWLLECADSKTTGIARIAEEIGMTSIFLATFSHWLWSDQSELEKTGELLNRLLEQAERLARHVNPRSVVADS